MSQARRQWRSVRDSHGRTWYHPSVADLISADGSTTDPEQVIRRRARQLTQQALEMGWSGPPYDVGVIASLAGLRLKEARPLPDHQSALLFGTAVFTNANQAEVRQRYSVGHEVTHTFFSDRNNSPQFSRTDYRDPDGEVEYLCQVGAAEIVMPHSCFRSKIASLPFELKTAFELADLYRVSPEAALRRLVDFADGAAAAVVLALGFRKSERPPEQPTLLGLEDAVQAPHPKLRIARRPHISAPLKARRIFFPQNKSVPDSSICYTALDERRAGRAGIHTAMETWEITGLGECRVEAVAWLERDGFPAGGMCLLQQQKSSE